MKKFCLWFLVASFLVLMSCDLGLDDSSSSEIGDLRITFVGVDETKFYYFGGTRNGVLTYQYSGIDDDDPSTPTGKRIADAGNVFTLSVLNTGTWNWVIHEPNEATGVEGIASATKNNTVTLPGIIIENGKTSNVTADFSD